MVAGEELRRRERREEKRRAGDELTISSRIWTQVKR